MSRAQDLEALRRLKAGYIRCVDTKSWADLRALLTDDFVYWRDPAPTPSAVEPTYTSADAFVAGLSAAHAHSVTVHQAYLPELTLLGPRAARGVWAMSDWLDATPNGVTVRGFGHYHEEYAKASGAWRLRCMRLTRLRLDIVGATDPAELDRVRQAWARGELGSPHSGHRG